MLNIVRYLFTRLFDNPKNGKSLRVHMEFAVLVMGVYIAEIE